MKKAGFRFVLLMLVLVTALGFIPQSASAAYENTHTNTGNYRQDIIAIAWTQVGYREDGGSGSNNNNNKYGAYFGNNYDSWCGYFVSWCAVQAGIPTSILKRTGWASPSSFGLVGLPGESYTPVPGDLFFQPSGSGYKHVGLVVEVNAAKGTVITIEGNTWDSKKIHGVYKKERDIKGNVFGSPNYGDGGGGHSHTYGDLAYESAHPHKAYKACTVCGSKSYTGATKTVEGCQGCCSHSYGSWSSTGSSKHQHTCSKCGYKESKNHTWGGDEVIKEATCKAVGTKKQTCSACGATRTTDIPKLTSHSFGPWEKVDEATHQRLCKDCGTKENQEHKTGTQWQSDEEKHWYVCEICQGAVGEEQHTEREFCSEACQVCGYVKPDGHLFEETYSWDENFHFRKCMFCPGQTDITPHQMGTELASDREGHYYPCTGCGYHSQPVAHNLSDPATEERAQVCLDCGFEYAPKRPHIHSYLPMSIDWEAHWGVCRCGEVYTRQNHKISQITGICMVCMQVPPEKKAPTSLEWMTEKATILWDTVAEGTASAWGFVTHKTADGWTFLTAEENRLYLYITCGGAALVLGGLTTTIVLLARKSRKKKKIEEPVA